MKKNGFFALLALFALSAVVGCAVCDPAVSSGENGWHDFFTSDGKLDGADFVLPNEWSFEDVEGQLTLVGKQGSNEKRDGLVVSSRVYTNFEAEVTWRMHGGNSALYFRAVKVNKPWGLAGFQCEIAGDDRDSALWHTDGSPVIKGRGWVAKNDALIAKVRNDGGWNTNKVIVKGDHIQTFLNGVKTIDIVDHLCEKEGHVALQLHGGKDERLEFRNFRIREIAD